MAFLSKILGDPNARVIRDLEAIVQRVNAVESEIVGLSDEGLRAEIDAIRAQHPTTEQLDAYLPRVFAIVREITKRKLNQRHYDVQIMGGVVLHQGKIAEMKTGEGKTQVATLPLTLNALTGAGVHLVTINDYLAKRDAQWMGPIYHALGLSVGVIQHEAAFVFDPASAAGAAADQSLRPVERREAYAADILYGTNNEFGFDYLRDNMVPELPFKVQRPLSFAIVDEVDSILIDEARTPLIISAPAEESTEQYFRFAELVRRLREGEDFNVDEKMRSATLTEAGMTKMESFLGVKNMYDAGGVEMAHHIEQALKAQTLFKRDKDYVVREGEVVIVDEFTGRLMFGRRYSEGLHQAIEAKEGVDIKQESQTLATITFQNFFRLYKKLAGMTGTAATEAEEFSKIYNLDVVVVPTNKPMVRQDASDAIFQNETGKFMAVVRDIKRRNELGQPVLVGTISIEKNEILHELLTREGIPHEILNAKNHEREASIIAQAGRRGAVTIATNMAGRGVDIILGGNPPDSAQQAAVRDLGGLHVLGTERHEARRIDNQLRGRSGRQGDPGSSQFFVSLDDDLMRIFGSDRLKSVMARLKVPEDLPIENGLISRSIESAQHKVEGHNFDIRKHLVEYDDVMNKHREVLYRRRNEVLAADQEHFVSQLVEIIDGEVEHVVAFHTAGDSEAAWNIDEIYESVDAMFPVPLEQRIRLDDIRQTIKDKADRPQARDALYRHLAELGHQALKNLEERLGGREQFSLICRSVLLRTIDTLWIEHLDNMTDLRDGIGLRGYGQRDPLVEYKREAYRMFTQLTQTISSSFATTLFKVTLSPSQIQSPLAQRQRIESGPAKQAVPAQTGVLPVVAATSSSSVSKVGRNDPCPCGSGKKYKKCHGQ